MKNVVFGGIVVCMVLVFFLGVYVDSSHEKETSGEINTKSAVSSEKPPIKAEIESTESTEKETTVNEAAKTRLPLLNNKAGSSIIINRAMREQALTYDEQIAQAQFSGSALLIKNGNVVLSSSYGYSDFSQQTFNSVDSEYYITSVQKAITATLIMKLVEEHKLTLTDTLDNYFDEAIPQKENISIDDLLSMTSGLKLEKTDLTFTNADDYFAYVCSHLKYEKAEKWKYRGVNYTLLTMVLERITSQTYEELVREHILAKVSLPHTEFVSNELLSPGLSRGYSKSNPQTAVGVSAAELVTEKGTGNIAMDTQDLYHFYRELISGRFISKTTLSQMWQRKPQNYTYNYKAGSYHKADGVLYAHGFLGEHEPTMYMSADAQTCVILLSNSKDKPTYGPLAKALFESLSY